MQDDDQVCLCFHVSKRKLTNYLRIEKPARASQLSNCGGAGTGCGWCRPFLEKLFAAAQAEQDLELPSCDEYSHYRQAYIAEGKGTPPTS